MNAAAERCQHADAPISQFVAAPFDQDGPVVRDDPCRRGLIGEIPEQVLSRLTVEIVVFHEPLNCGRRRHVPYRSNQFADLSSELERTPCRVGLPERHLSRFTGSWRNEYTVVGNL